MARSGQDALLLVRMLTRDILECPSKTTAPARFVASMARPYTEDGPPLLGILSERSLGINAKAHLKHDVPYLETPFIPGP